MQEQLAPEKPTETTLAAASSAAGIDIDLRDPWLAAFLAWLIPGLGHFYQRRWAKGVLFFVCIFGTFVFGFEIGGGKVVYASFRPQVRRLHYFCQAGVGLPAMPALVQAMRVRQGKKAWGTFMAPPDPGPDGGELHVWHEELHRNFELGTVFTMIAGLLNILAIFDAWAGPVIIVPSPKKEKPKGKSPPDPTGTG